MDKNWFEFFQNDRFAYHNGMRLTHIEPGVAEAVMAIEDNHLNAANMVQGGAIFTLADYAFAAASNACGSLTVGVNCNINYIKSPKGRILYAKARKISSGNRLCTYQVDITDDEGEYIACYTAMGYIKNTP